LDKRLFLKKLQSLRFLTLEIIHLLLILISLGWLLWMILRMFLKLQQSLQILVRLMLVLSMKNKIKQIQVLMSKEHQFFSFRFKEERDLYLCQSRKWYKIKCNKKIKEYNLLQVILLKMELIKLHNLQIETKNRIKPKEINQ
jgi:hypothetical protein